MKTVFTNRDICHVFANSRATTQTNGRTSSGSIFFLNDTIYSYGEHFPMAGFLRAAILDDYGHSMYVVLVNPDSYSVTTNKHQAYVRGAFHGLTYRTFSVPLPRNWNARQGLTPEMAEAAQTRYAKECEDLMGKAKRSRKYADSLRDSAKGTFAEWVDFCRHFDLQAPAGGDELNPDAIASELEAIAERHRIRLADQSREDAIRNASRNVGAFDAFRNGASDYAARELSHFIGKTYGLPPELHHLSAALAMDGHGQIRTPEDGPIEVVTSRGARVALGDFMRAYAILQKNPSALKGRHIGAFEIVDVVGDALHGGYVSIGCHAIPLAECDRIARTVGNNPPTIDPVADALAELERKAERTPKATATA